MNRARTDYRFLFFSLIAMSLAGPLLGPAFADRGILEVTFAAVLIAVVARSTRGPLQVTLSLVLGSLALLSLLAGRFTETGFLPMAQSALLACFLSYIAFLVLSDILSTQGVTSHEVEPPEGVVPTLSCAPPERATAPRMVAAVAGLTLALLVRLPVD